MMEQRNNRGNVGSDFRRQVYWMKAQAFAEAIAELVLVVPRDRAADIVTNQLLRSATSIPANITEGYGRFSQPAYRNHLSIARGSAFESESWIDLLQRRRYISSEKAVELQSACTELQKLITIRMKSLLSGRSYAGKAASADDEG